MMNRSVKTAVQMVVALSAAALIGVGCPVDTDEEVREACDRALDFLNECTDGGGGILNFVSCATVTNTVICRNTPDQVVGEFTDGGGNAISDDHCLPVPSLTPPPGDIDDDGDVDLEDYEMFLLQFTGPAPQ